MKYIPIPAAIIAILFSCLSPVVSFAQRPVLADSGIYTGQHHLEVSDSAGSSFQLTFGVDTSATSCLDEQLGEISLPPIPSQGIFDARFTGYHSDQCIGNGTLVNIHHFDSAAQVDTFSIRIQAGNQSGLLFRWDEINAEYFGNVFLRDSTGSINVDMRSTQSFRIAPPNPLVLTLFIIAAGPIYAPPVLPVLYTIPRVDHTDRAATLQGTILTKGDPVDAYFEWGGSPSLNHVTPSIPIADLPNVQAVGSVISGLTKGTTYYFRLVAHGPDGTAYGNMESFRTFGTAVPVARLEFPPTTNTTEADLAVEVFDRGGLPTTVTLRWGWQSYDNEAMQIITQGVDTDRVSIQFHLSQLQPGLTYHFALSASNANGTSDGTDNQFTTRPAVLSFLCTMRLVDSTQTSVPIRFGLHRVATPCIDPGFGEAELPPMPPNGYLDFRFIGKSCIGNGLNLDVRPYLDSTQVDTFTIIVQPGLTGYPVTITWDDLRPFYLGPVSLESLTSNLGADMLVRNRLVVGDDSDRRLRIIAARPLYTAAEAPRLATGGVLSLSSTSATLTGSVLFNATPIIAWIQWGESLPYTHDTPSEPIDPSETPTVLKRTITGLTPGQIYHYRIAARNDHDTVYGHDTTVLTPPALAVGDDGAGPQHFGLDQNYPNPFNPTTTIGYTLPELADVTIRIYNMLGVEVAALSDGVRSAGDHLITWNATGLPSGIYQYRIFAVPGTTGKAPFTMARRMIFLK